MGGEIHSCTSSLVRIEYANAAGSGGLDMPYKDPEKLREYQRVWVAKRRAKYLEDKSCEICGSKEGLQIDHVNPEEKWTHRFWSYKWETILAELAKCQILCSQHHYEKTADDIRTMKAKAHGTIEGYTKYHCRCERCQINRSASPDQYDAGLTLDEAKAVLYS